MIPMNASLPNRLNAFVDEQVSQRGYVTASEYVHKLARCDQGRLRLCDPLLAGVSSAPKAPVNESCLGGWHGRLRGAAEVAGQPRVRP